MLRQLDETTEMLVRLLVKPDLELGVLLLCLCQDLGDDLQKGLGLVAEGLFLAGSSGEQLRSKTKAADMIFTSTPKLMVMPANLETSCLRSSMVKQQDSIILSSEIRSTMDGRHGVISGEPGRRGRHTRTNQRVETHFLLQGQALLVAS